MGIAGFFLWLQRHYGRAIVEIERPKKAGNKTGLLPPPDAVSGDDGVASPAGMASPSASFDAAAQAGGDANNNNNNTNGRGRGDFNGRGGGGGRGRGRGPPPLPPSRRVTSIPCDNLYLDMNGLIHPCCHDTAPRPEPEDEEEMLDRIFEAVDKLVELVRPRSILYMAVDGVAPRSKMNQQRARRFRAAAERQEASEIAHRMADVVVDAHQLPRPSMKDKWDHNVITPATGFMDRVGSALEWYIVQRLNDASRPEWRGLTVVFSDAHVPGEGEHKIMNYIRALRTTDGYDPNTRHLIHGQDADLIMLALATHEAQFGVLRNSLNPETFQAEADKFCVFDIAEFRHLLRRDMGALESDSSQLDFERVIDDFVFLCFLIGNDFLPHMPLVDIKCKGIETILDHYVRNFDHFGYLTEGGRINFDIVGSFISTFADARLSELLKLKEGGNVRIERAYDRMNKKVHENREAINARLAGVLPDDGPDAAEKVGLSILKLYIDIAREQLRLVAGKHPLPFEYGVGNYRDEYYKHRFGWSFVDAETGQETRQSRAVFEQGVALCVREYLRGMQWVMWYYTSGCPSWEWFYPYHYAPLLQDVGRYGSSVDIKMNMSAPLHPVEQLLAVLPRESVHALPKELHNAVLDETSVLAKYYPAEMLVDYSEAVHSWQGVTKLPFVNCKGLKRAVREVVHLEPDEGWNLVYTAAKTPLARALDKLVGSSSDDQAAAAKVSPDGVPVTAEVTKTCPLAGSIAAFEHAWPQGVALKCPDAAYASKYPNDVGSVVKRNNVATYRMALPHITPYTPQMLRGAKVQPLVPHQPQNQNQNQNQNQRHNNHPHPPSHSNQNQNNHARSRKDKRDRDDAIAPPPPRQPHHQRQQTSAVVPPPPLPRAAGGGSSSRSQHNTNSNNPSSSSRRDGEGGEAGSVPLVDLRTVGPPVPSLAASLHEHGGSAPPARRGPRREQPVDRL